MAGRVAGSVGSQRSPLGRGLWGLNRPSAVEMRVARGFPRAGRAASRDFQSAKPKENPGHPRPF